MRRLAHAYHSIIMCHLEFAMGTPHRVHVQPQAQGLLPF